MKFQNPSLNSVLNGRMDGRTDERTSRNQYAPHFFKVGGIKIVEMCQRSVYIDVSQIKHSMMRMKTTDNMRTVNSSLPNCSLNFVV